MKHISLIIDHRGEVKTQFETGYLSVIDSNRSIETKNRKDTRAVIFNPDFESFVLGDNQRLAHTKTALEEICKLQKISDVRTPAGNWKVVDPDVITLWVMREQDKDSRAILKALELDGKDWKLSPGPQWSISSPPKDYPWLKCLYRLTLTKTAKEPLPSPA